MTDATSLDELRRERARDMLALLDDQPPWSRHEIEQTNVQLEDGPLYPCSSREAAWVQPAIALDETGVYRTVKVPHAQQGVVTPFSPSMLVVTYTARYFLRVIRDQPPDTRNLIVVYGAVQAVELPATRALKADPPAPRAPRAPRTHDRAPQAPRRKTTGRAPRRRG